MKINCIIEVPTYTIKSTLYITQKLRTLHELEKWGRTKFFLQVFISSHRNPDQIFPYAN